LPFDQSDIVIETHNLVKRYGDIVAVDGVDLTVYQGEIFGILGPNGAGKTTTLEMLEGLRAPDSGSARLAGFDIVDDIDDVRKIIGVQLQTTSLFDYLTAAEIIELFAGLYGVDATPERVDALLSLVNLNEKCDARVDQLSGGQQQRLSIALSLVNDPVIAFMDEPTTGLDPGARRDLWQTVRNMRDQGTTVVLTTHYMEEAEILCDRIAIMDFGKVIALDTPRGLIRALESVARVEADIARGSFDRSDLEALPAVAEAITANGRIELHTTNAQQSLAALLNLSAKSGVDLLDLRTSQSSLEDVFLDLTGRSYVSDEGEDVDPEPEEPSRRSGLLRR